MMRAIFDDAPMIKYQNTIHHKQSGQAMCNDRDVSLADTQIAMSARNFTTDETNKTGVASLTTLPT